MFQINIDDLFLLSQSLANALNLIVTHLQQLGFPALRAVPQDVILHVIAGYQKKWDNLDRGGPGPFYFLEHLLFPGFFKFHHAEEDIALGIAGVQ
jgi:hypothetical protein